MLETPHVAVGVALATQFPNPWVAIPLALASHFVLDKIPHWNPHMYTETQKFGKPTRISTSIALVDIGAALVLGSAFAAKAMPSAGSAVLILACSLSSVASDVIKYPYYYFKLRPKWLVWWVKFERSMQVDAKSVFWGILTQVAVTVVSIFSALNIF